MSLLVDTHGTDKIDDVAKLEKILAQPFRCVLRIFAAR